MKNTHETSPAYLEGPKLWVYGNVELLKRELACSPDSFDRSDHTEEELARIETYSKELVLEGKVIVSGIHNDAHRHFAIVPLRWGAPRILVLSGGFYHHLGPKLDQEPFRAARLWRYMFDPKTDLVVSRRAPNKLPTYSKVNKAVDALIRQVVAGEVVYDALRVLRPTEVDTATVRQA